MGEAAEYEIWRRHGIDISDDAEFEARLKPKRHYKKEDAYTYDGDSFVPSFLVTGNRIVYQAPNLPPQHIDSSSIPAKYGGLMHNPYIYQSAYQAAYELNDEKRAAMIRYGIWNSARGEIKVADIDDDYLQNLIRWANNNDLPLSAEAFREVRAARVEEQQRQRAQEESNGASKMNTEEMITIMQLEAGATLFKAVFAGESREYIFKDALGLNLAAGDQVVVKTVNRLKIVKVSGVEIGIEEMDGLTFGSLQHAICKVDMSAYCELLQRERSAKSKLVMAEVSTRLDAVREKMGRSFEQASRALLGKADEDQVIDNE